MPAHGLKSEDKRYSDKRRRDDRQKTTKWAVTTQPIPYAS